jgi:L-rhamnose mutarotase
MKRYGMIVGVDGAKTAEYVCLHAAVRPDGLKMTTACNIRNCSI